MSRGPEPHFLINPYGLNYSEVTARNLVKIDLEGNVLDGSDYPVNLAGFVIHGAIHAVRHDAHCVIHTHTTAGMAVACKEEGLRFDNFYSAEFFGDVGYHEFEGISTDVDEAHRLAANIGAKRVLILRNHGLVLVGVTFPRSLRITGACSAPAKCRWPPIPCQELTSRFGQKCSMRFRASCPKARGALEATGVRRGQVFFDAACVEQG